ncbi:MAG: cytochrome d ubiquinol oxidase subunit II [Chloroflexi bacterium]|nr:cytochrome d ubiquinol oxidase subunit II [Chloroflexota bacterium]
MQTVWFCVLALGLSMYTILDGFDLGVGVLHLWIARNDTERRTALSAIGPVWDGNEVWLIAGGGLLVLSFPRVYAAGFSGFYLALIMALWLLMGRGLSLEWRANVNDPMWRGAADVIFSMCSILLAVVLGVAVGNIVHGVPLNTQGYYQGLFEWMLNPYALLMGLFSLVLLALHGANWLAYKTEGPVQQRARLVSARLWPALVILAIVATIATFLTRGSMGANYHDYPFWLVVPLLTAAALGALWYFRRQNHDLRAFLSSCAVILALFASTAIAFYPNLLPSNPHPERSLTINNSFSSNQALVVGIIWLSIGLTIALAHIAFVYYLFRGKVVLEEGGHY